MSQTGIAVFDMAEQRLAWADRRQAILARNVANAATPGFRPHDVKPFSLLRTAPAGPLARTNPRHLASTAMSSDLLQEGPAGDVHAPDGNAVSLDRQLIKVADTANIHAMTTAIYRKYLAMFAIAVNDRGRG
jgi:flagellar basal-body rod protein FlgB